LKVKKKVSLKDKIKSIGVKMKKTHLTLYSSFLHSKQHEFAVDFQKSKAKFRILNTGRQFGKTVLIPEMMKEKAMKNNKFLAYISHTFSFSLEMYNKLYNVFNAIGYIIGKRKGKYLILKNGTRINFYSYDKYDNLRGLNEFTHIFLDEAAKLPNVGWEEVVSFLCNPECVEEVYLISTPRGKNWFYQMYLKALADQTNYIYRTATSYDSPFVTGLAKEGYDAIKGSIRWLQEVMAEFIDNGGEVFKNINSLFKLDKNANFIQERCYGGVDIALVNDFTVITVLNEKKELVFYQRFNRIDYDEIVEAIAKVILRFKCKIGIEKNNQGIKVIEKLNNYKGGILKRYIFEFQTWQNQVAGSKNILIQDLVDALENGQIKLLKKDKSKEMWQVEHEFSSYEGKESRFGNMIYGKAGVHDDTVISIGLANHMVNQYERAYKI